MPLSWVLKPLAVASALAFSTLGVLSTKYQKARFYFHSTIFLTTLGAASLWGLVISAIAVATGQRFNLNYYVARSFYQVAHPLIGMDFDVEGEEHINNLMTAQDGQPQSAVIIGNHQSMVDILYLGRIFPKRTSIMAKKELQWAPLLGQYMSLSGAVFINRGNRKDALRTVAQAGEDMKRRRISLWIFPEGTRASHEEPTLLPFKKGAFHLAIQAQVPIVIVVCENYNRLFDGRTRFDSGRLRLKILPPISTKGMTADDVHKLTELARDKMLETLIEISQPAPKLIEPKIKTPGSATPEEKPVAIDEKKAGLETPVSAVTSSESLLTKSDTTEDEMDDDAVVLKHPPAQAPAPATAAE